MRKLPCYVLLCMIMIVAVNAKAQFVEKNNYKYCGSSYDIFVIRIDTGLARNSKFVSNPTVLSEKDFFSGIQKMSGDSFFAITASIVDTACGPVGLFIEDGKELNKINLSKQGIGNFYSLQPNGVFFIADDNEVALVKSDDFNPARKYKRAIQTGPFLVIDGKMNRAFTAASKNKFLRCGLGIMKDQSDSYLVFVKSNEPVNFYDISLLFRDQYKCSNAILLEGSAGCSMHLPSVSGNYSDQVHVCRYFVINL